jgi:hypothetical protein
MLHIVINVYAISTGLLSVQAQYSRLRPIYSSFRYNSTLVTWTVVCLTAAKFKPLIFSKSGFAFSILRTFSLSWFRMTSLVMSLSLILRPTVSRPVCLGIKHPSGAYDQTFITVRELLVCWCGALSLTEAHEKSVTSYRSSLWVRNLITDEGDPDRRNGFP